MEVLDPEFTDDIVISLIGSNASTRSRNWRSTVASLRFSNVMRILHTSVRLSVHDTALVLHTFIGLFASKNWSLILTNLFSSCSSQLGTDYSLANQFLRKYRFYYRGKMNIYRVGKVNYENDETLNAMAISYAYLLYLIIQERDFHFFIDSLCTFSTFQSIADN